MAAIAVKRSYKIERWYENKINWWSQKQHFLAICTTGKVGKGENCIIPSDIR